MEEIRKDVVGYDGKYMVSNLGRIKSLKFNRERIMKLQIGNKGYYNVCLCKNNKKKRINIHRLVAIAFIPLDPIRLNVNHIDSNRLNSCVDNLEWCTQSENQLHSFKTTNRIKTRPRFGKLGKDSPRSKKIQQISTSGDLIKIWDSMHDIYREKGYHYSNICNVCKGNRPLANGYIRKYL